MEAIACNCLSIVIKRIHREVITTKCCNDIFPTPLRLKTYGYQDTDKCCLCSAQETLEHVFRCNNATRIKWRRQSVLKLKISMQRHNLEESTVDTFCSCVIDWLDTGAVEISKYHIRYHKAIGNQFQIGWHRVNMGKLSQEWVQLQSQYTYSNGNNRSAYI